MERSERAYERDWDRATRRHFDSKHAECPYYGFLLVTESADISLRVQEELQKILGQNAQVHRKGEQVFFSGPLDEQVIRRLRKYTKGKESVASVKALRGPYEYFPVNPDHLLERIQDYKH